MKNAVFWDVTPCGSCKNQHFGGMYCRATRIGELGTTTTEARCEYMEGIRSSETSVLTRVTQNGILE
jgi:hypothetical protein